MTCKLFIHPSSWLKPCFHEQYFTIPTEGSIDASIKTQSNDKKLVNDIKQYHRGLIIEKQNLTREMGQDISTSESIFSHHKCLCPSLS